MMNKNNKSQKKLKNIKKKRWKQFLHKVNYKFIKLIKSNYKLKQTL